MGILQAFMGSHGGFPRCSTRPRWVPEINFTLIRMGSREAPRHPRCNATVSRGYDIPLGVSEEAAGPVPVRSFA